MDILIFLSSGLFLGWSLGANDAANVFGTAVGTRMVRFRTAAVVCSIFVILGATISGAGAAHTLGRLGAVNTLAGSFTVALASALTTFWMTRLRMPVSTSQAIVGAIIGWNFYSASVTDSSSLTKIMLTWVACPVLSGVMAVGLFILVRNIIRWTKLHLLRLDAGTRLGLLVVGAFGSYSLGANNIANVMGVFVPDNPFSDISVFGILEISGTQQLFFLGAVAIAVGVFTYSGRVMDTVGGGLVRISPVSALVIVLSQSITLFLFASEGLEHFLASLGLPTLPLVPVSSSQAVVGAIVGISLYKGAGIRKHVLGGISLGWIATPVLAGIVAFFLLFFVDNVFDQEVYKVRHFRLDRHVLAELQRQGLELDNPQQLTSRDYTNAISLKHDLIEKGGLTGDQADKVRELALVGAWRVDRGIIAEELDQTWLTPDQLIGLKSLAGESYSHFWELSRALAEVSPQWRLLPDTTLNKKSNKELKKKLEYLGRLFKVDQSVVDES
ncbi:inorganic phosphate transporter [bacterium DOLJORAL78_65_58]|nr:MAG: inorganic phosphate transporter [bacterium DOLZORAL124_64_63]PIE76401.1 MAG: inorganic phosphate transporter [bacterium DOLJORAL78_65_58]